MANKKQKKTKNDSSLSHKALLVNISISQWSGRKVDKNATDSVMSKFEATKEAGKYHKKLLPKAHELEAISSVSSRVRKFFTSQTLPWFNDGTRILSGENYMDFTKEIKQFKNEFNDCVVSFERAYPQLQKQAQVKLGKLYNKEEYLHKDEIKDRFSINIDFMPLPDVKDFRTDISEDEIKEFERRVQEIQAKGLQECWTRLHDVVKIAVERLSNDKGTFRDSLIENITEVVDLLPKLNINGDKDLEASRKEIKAIVSKLEGPSLRKDAKARSEAKEKLAKVVSKMGAYMGTT